MPGSNRRPDQPLLTIDELPPVARFSLRVRPENRAALAQALRVDLPAAIGHRALTGGVEALCLGPDEWLLLAPEGGCNALIEAAAGIYPQIRHSLCEISDREITLRLSGPQALTALTTCCPRDIGAMPPGHAARTLFDSATVIIWRDAPDMFRMDIWRSFAPHIRALLGKVEAELRSGL